MVSKCAKCVDFEWLLWTHVSREHLPNRSNGNFFGIEWFGKKHSQHTLQKQLHQTQNYVSNMRSANRRDCFVIHVRQTAHNSCGQFGSKLKNRIRCTTPRANGWNWMNMLKNKFQVWSFDSADSQNMFVRFLPAWKKNTWFVPCNSVFNEGALPGNCHGSSNVRLLFFLYAVCFCPFLGLPAWSISTKNANSVRIETFDCCGRWWACPIWSREGNSAVAGVKCSNKTSKNHLFCSNKSDWTWLNYFVVDHNSQHVTTEHFIFQFMHGQQSMCKKTISGEAGPGEWIQNGVPHRIGCADPAGYCFQSFSVKSPAGVSKMLNGCVYMAFPPSQTITFAKWR